MQFANSAYVSWIFVGILAIAAFYVWSFARRSRLITRFAEKKLADDLGASAPVSRKILRAAFIGLAMVLCIAALARPQWGFEWEETKRVGLDIIVSMDVSKSMLATDVKPNRLERSKLAVKDMVKRLNGDRIALIAFAGSSFLQCPLTIDYDGFMLALDDLTTSTIPRGGTDISSAINEAIGIFAGGDSKFKVMIIITDGEYLEGDTLRAADRAKEAGIKIYCVGVGTPEGELIPSFGERGQKEYLEDNQGNVVKSKLNEDVLKKIAILTGGSYVRATQREFGLLLLYDTSISKLEKREIESKMRRRYNEQFQIFLAFALLFMILEPMIPEKIWPRR